MLLILGFNDKATTLSLHQPKGQWRFLLDNGHAEFAEPNGASSSAAPVTLDLTLGKQTLTLPAFPAWVYKGI
jgi:hypothetical protein